MKALQNTPRILVLGYGNPGRQDDGLGPAAAQALADVDGISSDADYQLNIEDAATAAEHDAVLFIDASKDGPAPFSFEPVRPSQEIAFTSHHISAESVMAICEEHFAKAPPAWMLGIRGYEFEMADDLTPQARHNMEQALAFAQTRILEWKDNKYDY